MIGSSHPPDDRRDLSPGVVTAALARFATGVTILSIRDPDGPDESAETVGEAGRPEEDGPVDDLATTLTAFMPVSLSPPLVAVAVMADGYLAEVLARRVAWGLSVLSAGQHALAGRFSAAGRPSARLLLAGEPHHRGRWSGALLLDRATATFECRTVERHPAGDHLLLVAEVLAASTPAPTGGSGTAPLLRYDRAYRTLGPR